MDKQHLLHSAHELEVGPRRPFEPGPGPTASVLIGYRGGKVQGVRNERQGADGPVTNSKSQFEVGQRTRLGLVILRSGGHGDGATGTGSI